MPAGNVDSVVFALLALRGHHLFLVLLLFIGLIFLLRGLYRATFIYLEVIFISAYLLTCLICMLFVFTATFKIFLMIVGLWFILSLYERKRF